jgi:hypothetical protein
MVNGSSSDAAGNGSVFERRIRKPKREKPMGVRDLIRHCFGADAKGKAGIPRENSKAKCIDLTSDTVLGGAFNLEQSHVNQDAPVYSGGTSGVGTFQAVSPPRLVNDDPMQMNSGCIWVGGSSNTNVQKISPPKRPYTKRVNRGKPLEIPVAAIPVSVSQNGIHPPSPPAPRNGIWPASPQASQIDAYQTSSSGESSDDADEGTGGPLKKRNKGVDKPEISVYELGRLKNTEANNEFLKNLEIESIDTRPRSVGKSHVEAWEKRRKNYSWAQTLVAGRFDGNITGWVYHMDLKGYVRKYIPSMGHSIGQSEKFGEYFKFNNLFRRYDLVYASKQVAFTGQVVQSKARIEVLGKHPLLKRTHDSDHCHRRLTAELIKSNIWYSAEDARKCEFSYGNHKFVYGDGEDLYGPGVYVKRFDRCDFNNLQTLVHEMTYHYSFLDENVDTHQQAGFYYHDANDPTFQKRYKHARVKRTCYLNEDIGDKSE